MSRSRRSWRGKARRRRKQPRLRGRVSGCGPPSSGRVVRRFVGLRPRAQGDPLNSTIGHRGTSSARRLRGRARVGELHGASRMPSSGMDRAARGADVSEEEALPAASDARGFLRVVTQLNACRRSDGRGKPSAGAGTAVRFSQTRRLSPAPRIRTASSRHASGDGIFLVPS